MTTTINGSTGVSTGGNLTATNLTLTGSATAPGGVKGAPAFSAYATSTTSTVAGQYVKVALQATEFDTNNAFDATNSRYKPTVAGYYHLIARSNTVANISQVSAAIYKNGVLAKSGDNLPVSGGAYSAQVSCLVYLNGVTDYVEFYFYANSATTLLASQAATYFQGHLVVAA